MMRALGFMAVAGALVATTVSANAQASNLGWGKNRGNGDQQSSGYEQVKKGEEKRFPLGSAWIAVSLNGKPYGGSERPAFTLDEQFRVQGFGGCNSFSATAFPLREQGIAVGPLAMTRRECDKAAQANEMAFLTALRTSAKWDTKVGSLVIKGPNGEIKFERSL